MANDLADYAAGSGLGVDAVAETERFFVGIPITLIVVWLAWLLYKTWRGWAAKKVSLYDLGSVSIQAFIVTSMFVLFLTLGR